MTATLNRRQTAASPTRNRKEKKGGGELVGQHYDALYTAARTLYYGNIGGGRSGDDNTFDDLFQGSILRTMRGFDPSKVPAGNHRDTILRRALIKYFVAAFKFSLIDNYRLVGCRSARQVDLATLPESLEPADSHPSPDVISGYKDALTYLSRILRRALRGRAPAKELPYMLGKKSRESQPYKERKRSTAHRVAIRAELAARDLEAEVFSDDPSSE